MKPTQKSIKEIQAGAKRARLVPSWRLVIAFTCCLGGFVAMFSRVKISFAVICMVQDPLSSGLPPGSGNSSFDEVASAQTHGEFQWGKQFQGLVLSAYFYGYVAALVIGGWVADRFPSHQVAIISVVGQATLLALMPEMTRYHPSAIIALRALQGVVASALYPAFNVILGKWSLDGEFAVLFSIAWSGGYFGSASSFPISSALCQSSFLGGWPAIFYLSALMMLVWSLLAALLMRESPEDHRFVSYTERCCLLSQTSARPKALPPSKPVSIWTLLGNLQVWIISLSYFGTSWFFASLNITLPTFMKEGFNFDITQNGFLSALPSISMATMILLGGKTFDFLHVTKGVSTTNARKIMSLIGLLVPSALMTAVLLLPASQRYLSVVLISLAQGFSSFVICSGPVSAAKEIAPQYMGIIWGVASSIGNTSGFLTPLVAAVMTPNGTLQEWCWFFVISIAMMVFLSALIGLCWKSEIQPFAKEEEDSPALSWQRNVHNTDASANQVP